MDWSDIAAKVGPGIGGGFVLWRYLLNDKTQSQIAGSLRGRLSEVELEVKSLRVEVNKCERDRSVLLMLAQRAGVDVSIMFEDQ